MNLTWHRILHPHSTLKKTWNFIINLQTMNFCASCNNFGCWWYSQAQFSAVLVLLSSFLSSLVRIIQRNGAAAVKCDEKVSENRSQEKCFLALKLTVYCVLCFHVQHSILECLFSTMHDITMSLGCRWLVMGKNSDKTKLFLSLGELKV